MIKHATKAVQFYYAGNYKKDADADLIRRDNAVIEQPAGAARGRNLRDAILRKEEVLDGDGYHYNTRLTKLLVMMAQMIQRNIYLFR